MKCSQQTCLDQAEWVYHWPGKTSQIYACWPHRSSAARIAETLGFTIVFRQLQPIPLETVYRLSGLDAAVELALSEDIGLATLIDTLRVAGAFPADVYASIRRVRGELGSL